MSGFCTSIFIHYSSNIAKLKKQQITIKMKTSIKVLNFASSFSSLIDDQNENKQDLGHCMECNAPATEDCKYH